MVGASPFTVLDHWDSRETQAILIKTGPAGSDECTTTYVVETRKPGEVAAHELGTSCVGFDNDETRREMSGFSLTAPATPTSEGLTTTWIAETGTLSKSRFRFEPVHGTTMADLMRHAALQAEAPLRNAEFYAAVDRLPAPDRIRMMTALWGGREWLFRVPRFRRSSALWRSHGCGHRFLFGLRLGHERHRCFLWRR